MFGSSDRGRTVSLNNNAVVKAGLSCLFLVSVIILVWKIPYGWGAYDEPFYIATPYRFIISNDTFIADEWNMAQLSSLLLLIPVKIYSLLFPDMEGVIISFRMLYTLIHILIALLLMRLLKNEGMAGVLSGLSYMLFVPFNIMNFSYDAIGLDCITLLIYAVYSCENPGKIRLTTIGILFACAVLCNPYLVIIFIIYFIGALTASIKKTEKRYVNIKDFLFVFMGILFPAAGFLTVLLMRTTVFAVLENLPYMLKDPTHGGISITDKLYTAIGQISGIYFPWIYLWGILLLFQIFDKNRSKRKKVYMILSVAVFAGSTAGFITNVRVNCYMLPLALLGMNMYALLDKKNRHTLYLWFTGLIYGIFMLMASDQGIYVVSMAMLISDIAAILIIRDVYNENRGGFLKYLILMIVLIQLMMEAVGLSRSTHWESERIEKLDTVYEHGPLKGLRTTADKVDTYNRLIEDIDEYRGNGEKRIAFMMLNTWEYLYAGRPYGTFSSWLGYTDDFIAEKFLMWCRLHPDSLPEDVYFSKLEESCWKEENVRKIASELGYEASEDDTGIRLFKR